MCGEAWAAQEFAQDGRKVFFGAQRLDEGKGGRDDEEGEEGGGDEPADDGNCHRGVGLRAAAAPNGYRKHL